MHKKLLSILLSILLVSSITGCQKKYVSSGDKELDAARDEIQEILEEDAKVSAKEEGETKPQSSNVDIKEVYLVNVKGINNLIVYFSNEDKFEEIDQIIVNGVEDGSKKELKNTNVYRSLLDPFIDNYLQVPIINEENEYALAFTANSKEYSSYEFTFRDNKSNPGSEHIVLNENTYTVKEEDIIKLDYDEFLEKKATELINSNKELNSFIYENLKFEYLGAEFSKNSLTILFNVTNTGDTATESINLNTTILTKKGIYEDIFVNGNNPKVQALNPGETTKLSIASSLSNKFDNFSITKGDDFLYHFEVWDNKSYEGTIYNFKSTF